MIDKILLYLRKSSKLTQKELATKVKMPSSTYSCYENKQNSPSFETVEKIAKAQGYKIIFYRSSDNKQITSSISKKLYITIFTFNNDVNLLEIILIVFINIIFF